MTRAEKIASPSPEKKVRRSDLDLQLAEIGTRLKQSYVFFHRDFEPQLEVLTIMTVLSLEDTEYQLPKTDKAKLQKMLGLQMRYTPRTNIFGDAEFWQKVDDGAKAEITKAANFSEDLNDMPKNWQPAYVSLLALKDLFNEPES